MRLLNKLFFFLFLFLSFFGYSQEVQNRVSLQNLIPQLEASHKIQFNYLESNIKKQVFFNDKLSLQNLLISLEKQTQLRFEIVDNTQIIVRPLKAADMVSVCGYVMNNDFPSAQIEVQISSNKVSVFTDKKGYFVLNKIPFGASIILKYNDVFLRKIPVEFFFTTTCKKIEVQFFSEHLKEVIIKNYITKGIIKEAQKVKIKPNEFSVLPGITEPDVMKSLAHIPSVQSPFEMPSKLYIRGSSPDQNLILWNGIKTYSSSHFFGLISSFNSYTIQETEFYDKGVQAKYGDRLAGVIDMKSSKKVHKKNSGGMGANLIYADAFANIPLIEDKMSFTISARRSYTDILKSPTYNTMAERVFQNTRFNETIKSTNNQFYFFDYSFGIQAQPTIKDALQFNMFYAQNDLVFENETLSNINSDDLLTKNEGYSLQWQHQYNDKLKQETSISFSNYSLDYLFEDLNVLTNEKLTETKKNFINDYGGQTSFTFDFNKKSQIQIGYQYSENSVRYEIKNTTDNYDIVLDDHKNKLQTHSLFSEYEIDFDTKALVQLGLRGNKYSTSNQFFIEPRLYTEATLLPNFKLNSTITYTSQAVTQIEESLTNSLTLENVLWRITDDNEFNILTSQQYSFGTIYKHKNWFIEADSFYKLTKNITTLTAGFLNPFNNGFTKGKSKTLGAELFIKKKFKNYSSWISYTFTNQKTQFDSVNNGAYFVSNLNIDHTFKWQHYYKLNDFQFSLGWLWHSGRATTNVTTNKEAGKPVELIYTDLNNENLPVYHKLDFSVLYNFKKKKNQDLRYQIGCSIQNIYNRKSILNREFVTTPGLDNELKILDFNSLGFLPNFSIRVFL